MQRESTTPGYRVDLALVLVVTIWSVNFILLKTVLTRIDPLPLAAVRFVAIALVFELLWRLRGDGSHIEQSDYPKLAVSALFGYTLYQAFFILGLDSTSAFSTALMINTGPAWAALILTLGHIERVSTYQWGGIVVALAGLAIYIGPKLLAGNPAGMGDLLGIGAAIAWTFYGIINKPLLKKYTPLHLTTRTFQVGAIFFLPFAAPSVVAQRWSAVTPGDFLALVYSVLFPIVVAVTLWNWAISHRGVGRTVVYQYLVPVVSGLLSWSILSETFGPWKVAGGAVILGGVALSRREPR